MEEKVKSYKTDILGVLCDTALEKYMASFATNTIAFGIIKGVFILLLGVWVAFGFLVWHPNFYSDAFLGIEIGIQAVNDILFFIYFIFITIVATSLFAMLNTAASGIVSEGGVSTGQALKKIASRFLPIITLFLSKAIVYLVVMGSFIVPIILDLQGFLSGGLRGVSTHLLAWGGVALLLCLLFKTLTFFSLSLAVEDKRYSFANIFASAKLVFKKGFHRILAITLVISTINIVLFLGILSLLNAIFSNYGIFEPMSWIEPTFYIVLFVTYMVVSFIGPKLGNIARVFLNPPAAFPKQAGLGSRTLANIVDIFICLGGFAIFFAFFVFLIADNFVINYINLLTAIFLALALFIVYILYNIYFEVFEDGKTPGKRMMSLKVTSEDDKPLTVLKSILRNVLRIVDIVSFVMILFDKKHHRLGDVMSYTKVCFDIEKIEERAKKDV